MGTVRPAPPLDEAPPPRWETRTVRTLIGLSALCWVGGIVLMLVQAATGFLSAQAFVIVGFWVMSIASVGLGLAPDHNSQHVTRLWQAVRRLPRAEIEQLAALPHVRPLVARPWLWRAVSYFSCTCWVVAIVYTAEVETGVLRPSLASLAVVEVFFLAGGVQGVITTFRGLWRARAERTYEIAVYGAPAHIPDPSAPGHPGNPIGLAAIASAALDERRDDTGQIPKVRAGHLYPVPAPDAPLPGQDAS